MATKGINRLTLREQVWATLREEILDGTLAAGTRLGEVELSERLGVSRGTVREALRRLQQSGLVEGEDRLGLSVASFSASQLRELFSVRAALEALAATSIVRQGRGEEAAALLQGMLPDPASAASLGEALDVDLRFHEKLCELSGNRMLLAMWRDLQDRVRVAVMSDPHARESSLLDGVYHQPIIDAVRAGDPDGARATLVEHMRHSGEIWASHRESVDAE